MSDDPEEPPESEGEEDGEEGESRRPGKSDSAFRTISEVADDLEVPQHVLRFWESKFPQIRPLKRGGGRRYYRPEDVALLKRIRGLLYGEGYTIKGVQKLLRESTAKPVAKPRSRPLEPSLLPIDEPVESVPVRLPAAPAAPMPMDEALRAELQGILDDLEHLRGLLQPRD